MRTAAYPLVFALLLAACGNPPSASTPPPVNSAQSTVALTVKTVADAASTCIDTVISLRNGGKLSAANATTIGNWCSSAAATDKQIGVILAKSETWAMQKAEILTLLATVAAPQIATTIDPGAQAIVAQIMTLVNQIKVQVAP